VAIDRETVMHVARLSRLELTEEEIAIFPEQLSEILEAAEALQKVDTSGVEPTYHVASIHNVFREDEPHPSMAKEQVLADAPQVQDGMFRVPRILEEE